jgi:hypothetical protein
LTGSPFQTTQTGANGASVLPTGTDTNAAFHYKADLATGSGSIDYTAVDAHPASYAMIVYQQVAAVGGSAAVRASFRRMMSLNDCG